MSTSQHADTRLELQDRANFEAQPPAMGSQPSSHVQEKPNLVTDQTKMQAPRQTIPLSAHSRSDDASWRIVHATEGHAPTSFAAILLENMAAIHDPDSTEAQSRISDIIPEETARPPHLDTVEAINARQEALRQLDETNGKKRSSLADMWQQADRKLQEERAVQDRRIREVLEKALRDKRLTANESRAALRTRQEDAFDLANQRTEEEEIELTRRLVRIRRGLPVEDSKQVNRAVSASYAPQTQRQDSPPPPKRHQSGPPSQNSPAGIPPPAYQFYQATYAPQSEQHVLPSKHVPYSLFPRDLNIPNGTPTPTPHHVPPPPPVGSGFTPVNVTATSGFAAVNSRPVNVEAIPSPAPNGIPKLTTPNIAVVERRPPPKSEAWEKRHHRCERYDKLGRGIWTSYGSGSTHETPTGPTVEMYLRCSHDNCMRMDWQTVHSLLVHLVRFHEQPKGTVGGLRNALDRYGVPVSDIEAYERQHGDGSAGAFAEHKKPKPRRVVVPPRHPASLASPRIPSPTMQEDSVRGTPSSSVGVSVEEGHATKSGYVQEEILYSSEDSDADNLSGPSSNYKTPDTGVGEKRKQLHDSAKAPARYLLPNGAPLRFSTQPENHQPAPVPGMPEVRNDTPAEPSTSLLAAIDTAALARSSSLSAPSTETPETPEIFRDSSRIDDRQNRNHTDLQPPMQSDTMQTATTQDSARQTPSTPHETADEVMTTVAAALAAASAARQSESRDKGTSSHQRTPSKSAQVHAWAASIGGQRQTPFRSVQSHAEKGHSHVAPHDRAASQQRSPETSRKPAEHGHGDYRDKSNTSRQHRSPEIAKQHPPKEQGIVEMGATTDSLSRPIGHPSPSSDLGKKHPRKDSISAPWSGMRRKDAARPSLPAGHTKAQSELQDLQKVVVIDDESADEGSNSMERNGSPPARRSTNRPIKKPTKYEGAL